MKDWLKQEELLVTTHECMRYASLGKFFTVSNCLKCQMVLGVKLSAVSNGPRIVFETLVCDPGS